MVPLHPVFAMQIYVQGQRELECHAEHARQLAAVSAERQRRRTGAIRAMLRGSLRHRHPARASTACSRRADTRGCTA